MTNPWLIDTAFRLLMKVNAPVRWGFQHTQWTLGIQQPHEWPEACAPFTLRGLECQLNSPMLLLFREDDIRSSAAATRSIVVGRLDFLFWLECERSLHVGVAVPALRGAAAVTGGALMLRHAGVSRTPGLVNGAAGILSRTSDLRLLSVMSFDVARGRIVEIDVLGNPARLRRLGLASKDSA
jgi:hypothetical protein